VTVYFLGIDIGSLSCDAVLIDSDKKVVASSVVPTGARNLEAIARARSEALARVGVAESEVAAVVATGYGRDRVTDREASVTEITCHGRGIQKLIPGVEVLIDIGGQDSKVIRFDREGMVADFAMNDKCAAGTGRFLEFYSDRRRQGLILDEHTIVLASRDLMPSVLEITARPDQAARFADTELCRSIGEHARLGRSALSVVFSVQSGMTDAVKDGAPHPSLFAKYEEAVRNITGVGASLLLTDGIQIDAAVVTTAEKHPPNLVELSNALILAFGLVQKDSELKQLVDSIRIKADGRLVRLAFHATEQQLFDALKKIEQELMEAAEEPGPAAKPAAPPAEQPAGKKAPAKAPGKAK